MAGDESHAGPLHQPAGQSSPQQAAFSRLHSRHSRPHLEQQVPGRLQHAGLKALHVHLQPSKALAAGVWEGVHMSCCWNPFHKLASTPPS